MADRLLRGEPSGSGGRRIGLFGREAELALLTEFLDKVARGRLTVGLVEGEPGIGKSTLADGVDELARHRGFAVFRGGADEMEQRRPFHPVAEALGISEHAPDADRRRAAAILSGDRHPGVDVAAPFMEAAVGLLEAETARRPVLLLIEDMHWADASTVSTLAVSVRRLADVPLGVMVTCRPIPRPVELKRWLEELEDVGTVRIALGPLTPEALGQLAMEMTGQPVSDGLLRQLARSGGNPLFAIEVIRAFKDDPSVSDPVLPGSLTAMVRRGLDALSPAARHLVEVASALGSRFRVSDLITVTGHTAAEMLPSVKEALTSGTIHEVGEDLAFRHDLLREVLYDALPLSVRGALHFAVAETFAAAGLPASRVGSHLLLGGADEGGEWLDLTTRVATELRQSAPGMSAELLQRAIDATGPRHPRYRDLLRASLWPLVLRGRLDEVDSLLATLAADHEDALDDPEIRQAAVYRHLRRGRVDLFRRDLETLAGRTLSLQEEAWVKSRLASAYVLTGDAARAAALIPVLEQSARQHPDERERVYCLAVQTLVLVAQGRVPAALDVARKAAALHGRLLSNVATVYLFVGIALADGDQFGEAHSAISAGLREDLEEGDLSSLSVHHFFASLLAYESGDWDLADTEAETGLELYAEGGQATTAVLVAHAVRARIAVHRGNWQDAERSVAEGQGFVGEFGPGLGIELFGWAEGHLMAANGAAADAVLVKATLGWDLTEGVRYLLSWRTVAVDLVRWALAAEDRGRAESVAGAAAEGARRAGAIASARATAAQCLGLVSGDADGLVQANQLWKGSPRAVSAARSAEDAAGAFEQAGDAGRATRLRVEAAEGWERLGADADAARCREYLGRPGHGRRSRGPAARPATGWASLTPRELKVAELLASGLTNRLIGERLFVSRHTVDTHVRHILAKLGMRSRVEIAAEVTRQNP